MSYSRIEVEPRAAHIGALVSGVDLSEPLDEITWKELHEAWMKHAVLFFRDQPMTIEQHKALGLQFGELMVHPVLQPLKDQGHPEVFVLHSTPERPFVAEGWHTDVTFEPEPPMASILRALDVPKAGGDTMWASMTAAYEGLSSKMQAFLCTLQAVHDPGGFRLIASDEAKEHFDREDVLHPVIRTHPVTGRKGIFVNSTFTTRIKGMRRGESRALLEFLYEHATKPEYTVRFHWEPDSVAIWDNRCTQHSVIPDAHLAERLMHRVTIAGDRPS